MSFLLDQKTKITFLDSQETIAFFAFCVCGFLFGFGFFSRLHMNPSRIAVGLPENFAGIALYACLGTWRGGLFGFSYFVFLFSRSSPADS